MNNENRSQAMEMDERVKYEYHGVDLSYFKNSGWAWVELVQYFNQNDLIVKTARRVMGGKAFYKTIEEALNDHPLRELGVSEEDVIRVEYSGFPIATAMINRIDIPQHYDA